MILFNKNTWHSFFMTIFSFYAVFTFINNLLSIYEIDFVQDLCIPLNYYWIIAYLVAFLSAMLMVAIFCKVTSPLFQAISVFVAGTLSMYDSLYLLLSNMDRFFRQDGLAALIYLLPHFMVILGSLAAYILTGLAADGSMNINMKPEIEEPAIAETAAVDETIAENAPSVVTVTKTEIESKSTDAREEAKLAKEAVKAEKKALKESKKAEKSASKSDKKS